MGTLFLLLLQVTYDSNCLNESSERQRRRFINESSDWYVSVMNFITSLEDGDDSMWGKQKAVISGFQFLLL